MAQQELQASKKESPVKQGVGVSWDSGSKFSPAPSIKKIDREEESHKELGSPDTTYDRVLTTNLQSKSIRSSNEPSPVPKKRGKKKDNG